MSTPRSPIPRCPRIRNVTKREPLPRVIALEPGGGLTAKVVLFVMLLLMFGAGRALAADAPPPPDQDAAAWLKALYTAITSKEWGIVSGVILVGLVYPIRRFGPDFLKGSFGGIVLAFLVSLCATLGAGLAVGVPISLALVASAAATAATAAGVWEWIKTHLLGGSTPASTTIQVDTKAS